MARGTGQRARTTKDKGRWRHFLLGRREQAVSDMHKLYDGIAQLQPAY